MHHEFRRTHPECFAPLPQFGDIEPPLTAFALADEGLCCIEPSRQLLLSDAEAGTRGAQLDQENLVMPGME